jgi:hypothetical protein
MFIIKFCSVLAFENDKKCKNFWSLAPNPTTAARFLYVENIVQTNLHRLSLIREKKRLPQVPKIIFYNKIENFQGFHFICFIAPEVFFLKSFLLSSGSCYNFRQLFQYENKGTFFKLLNQCQIIEN